MGQALGAPVGQSDLGVRLLRKGLVHEAIPFLERSHVEEPQEWQHLSNLGVAHRLEGEFVQAKQCLQQALRLSPDSPEIWLNFGVLMCELGEFADAREAFRVACEWMPYNQIAVFNYADALLRFGHYHEAWPLFEIGRIGRTVKLPEGIARWRGESLQGKRILVVREGGMGDTFLYSRWLADLKGSKVTLMVSENQKKFFENQGWEHEIATKHEGTYDFCVPIMSLPALLDADLGIPAEVGYLRSPRRLVGAQPNKKKVGICWKAREMSFYRKIRSLSEDDLKPLIDMPVEWISLQQGKCLPWMTNVDEYMHDWKDTAEVVQGLDLVVSCDTAVANLAGALGRPTWILLPINYEWKWGLKEDSTPLYPTARLFRQSRLWIDVVKRVAKELS